MKPADHQERRRAEISRAGGKEGSSRWALLCSPDGTRDSPAAAAPCQTTRVTRLTRWVQGTNGRNQDPGTALGGGQALLSGAVKKKSRNPPRSEGLPALAAAPEGSGRLGRDPCTALARPGPARTAPPPQPRFCPRRKQRAVPRKARPRAAAPEQLRRLPRVRNTPAGAHLRRRRSPAPPARRT